MLTADESTTEDALSGSSARYARDNTLLVKFYYKPMQDSAATQEAGRPIFKEVPFVRIQTPGNKDNVMSRPAMEMDKQRFAEHWRKFQAREEQTVEGTLLSEWGGVTRSQVEEMKFLNIVTVEQLAELADNQAQNMMGLQTLKQKAQAYLEDADKNALTAALTDIKAENAAIMEERDIMKQQLAMLMAAAKVEPEDKPKRKRRTKAELESDASKALESIKME